MTTFIANAEKIALDAFSATTALARPFSRVILFLSLHPENSAKLRGKNPAAIGSEAYIRKLADSFTKARKPKSPTAPETIPDEMVSVILEHFFGVPSTELKQIQRTHKLSMGAENMVGELLERYLASVMEPLGWIWCSGSVVKAVDFILPPKSKGDQWTLLQVKNRDNSENSSSSAVRKDTTIKKWFRTFSTKAGQNWSTFPDPTVAPKVSEAAFKKFVNDYLRAIKQSQTT